MGLLTVAVAGPVLVILTSTVLAAFVTMVRPAAGSSLFPYTTLFRSTVAVLVMVPAVAGAVALIVTEAVAPLASEPTAQVTVPEALVERKRTRLNASHTCRA